MNVRELIKRLLARSRPAGPLFAVMLLTGAAGFYLVGRSDAASFVAMSEAESGTIASPAVGQDNTSASAGKAVEFRAASLPTAAVPGLVPSLPCTEIFAAGTSMSAVFAALDAGDVGCLRGGNYAAATITKGGVNDNPIILQSYPGERATITGKFWVNAPYLTFQNLNFDGTGAVTNPLVTKSNVTFRGNDVYNGNTAICFMIGNVTHGSADNLIIDYNKIHHCGTLPPANHDHGIYVSHALDITISNNWIYKNADRGIQFYPDYSGERISGGRVYRNVIDSNGSGIIFSGSSSASPTNNIIVENNIITNSNVRNNVESWWAGAVGTGNIVRNNCVYGSVQNGPGGISTEDGGFTISGNIVQDPQYVNRPAYDYTLKPSSPCLAIWD